MVTITRRHTCAILWRHTWHRNLQHPGGFRGRPAACTLAPMSVATRSSVETTLSDLKERAAALVPRLRERAHLTEELRRLPEDTVDEFRAAGLFRVLQPSRFGGFELDYGRTQVELCTILGQGCGSSAWVQCVIACHAWCLGMFAPAA
jgi:3-hydroxy-9,10-secoandrosta-1,3,5(10)-triene-9,17-dione monooxygenase